MAKENKIAKGSSRDDEEHRGCFVSPERAVLLDKAEATFSVAFTKEDDLRTPFVSADNADSILNERSEGGHKS